MKSERILYALGGVNPAFVEEASPERRTLDESSRRLRRAAVRWSAALVCATALVLVAVFVDWREILWPRPVTPSAEAPSASTSLGMTAAVMLTLEIRIDAWRADGFEGTVVKPVVYPADTPFTGGQTVLVRFRPNGTTVEGEGEYFSYGNDSSNAADCGLAVGTVVWVDYQSYEETADAEPVITHIGLGQDGKKQRVVVGVIESRADEYRRLFLWKYGGRANVVSEERCASPSQHIGIRKNPEAMLPDFLTFANSQKSTRPANFSFTT